MFSKTSLLINVLIAAVAGFFMNIAVYELAEEWSKEEVYGLCGTVDSDFSYPSVELSDVAVEGENIFKANCAA